MIEYMPRSDVKVSFLLFSYNHERFLPEACRSILAQTHQPDEVILCDDGSTDGSRGLLAEFATRLPRATVVKLLLDETNHGLAATINKAFAVATGELWVLQAGDDYSSEDRVEKVLSAYEASGRKARSICSNAEVIDAHGEKKGNYFPENHLESYRLESLASGNNGVLGATQCLQREVWDVFGAIPNDVFQEDVILPFRAAILGVVIYISAPLVDYRFHSANLHFVGRKPGEALPYLLSRTKLEAKLRNNIAIARGRLLDVARAKKIGRLEDSRAGKLMAICERTLRDAKVEYTIGLASRHEIAGLLVKAIRLGVPFRRCLRMALCYLSPTGHAIVLNAWVRFSRITKRLREMLGLGP